MCVALFLCLLCRCILTSCGYTLTIIGDIGIPCMLFNITNSFAYLVYCYFTILNGTFDLFFRGTKKVEGCFTFLIITYSPIILFFM